ncbi:heterokaryon incompatibility protein-domain-containing protein [Paraphoma chrysanthemicola]|nr:heterokaryon incompatibility protein-domain-containing protein [Paraphoma chrysanthemicola]
MVYTYAPLPGARSIRLLRLLPGSGSALLKCHLITQELDSSSSYDALSYVWGVPDLREALFVDGGRLNISANLHSIITQLRDPHKDCILWIDAICIDQQNDYEKSLQVAMMGQIYRQAETVICWLHGNTTGGRAALAFLQSLERDARPPEDKWQNLWAATWDPIKPNAGVDSIIESALQAGIEAIYLDSWFSRVWIVQEVTLAKNPVVYCSGLRVPWKDLEFATRILAHCVKKRTPQPKGLRCIEHAYHVMNVRAQYGLISLPRSKGTFLQHDQAWALGNVAFHCRIKHCKDDRDRAYAMLSLISAGNSLGLYAPKPFAPDYSRSAEWAYGEFWVRYGGYSSLFLAGLSRRRRSTSITNSHNGRDYSQLLSNEYHLASWCPELRLANEHWQPIFTSDYIASQPFHHAANHLRMGENPKPLLLRGHRIDTVEFGFYFSRSMETCQQLENLVDLRRTIKMLLALRMRYAPYPTGQEWTNALGFALMTGMPSGDNESAHPFQRYLDTWNLNYTLNNDKLMQIWHTYIHEFISDSGSIWSKFQEFLSHLLECKRLKMTGTLKFDPGKELSPDHERGWILHKYLGDILQKHMFIFTSQGYMGLAPPDTLAGDVVAVLGGPGTAFTIRDTPIVVTSKLKVVPDENPASEWYVKTVGSEEDTVVAELMGPCYLWGVMDGEMWKEMEIWKGKGREKSKGEGRQGKWEWEEVNIGSIPGMLIPRQTICLV